MSVPSGSQVPQIHDYVNDPLPLVGDTPTAAAPARAARPAGTVAWTGASAYLLSGRCHGCGESTGGPAGRRSRARWCPV
ncbi:hypothetical protein GCM10023350_45650 [Nocardioides endophyticus]|uniref:Uncharacterized protein n=1 Tax=Nocardioides endophyticus TaxID=1353775 RepID=A0ABP8ZF26_9ACTN